MKVIDLLNKIANGEEVPKKLKIKKWEYNGENKNLKYELFDRLYEEDFELNDEVEIIEEEKKIPEKLATWYSVETTQNAEENVEYANYNFETMYEKINEICDYLKSKGDE